jgi:hypothetical protein
MVAGVLLPQAKRYSKLARRPETLERIGLRKGTLALRWGRRSRALESAADA